MNDFLKIIWIFLNQEISLTTCCKIVMLWGIEITHCLLQGLALIANSLNNLFTIIEIGNSPLPPIVSVCRIFTDLVSPEEPCINYVRQFSSKMITFKRLTRPWSSVGSFGSDVSVLLDFFFRNA